MKKYNVSKVLKTLAVTSLLAACLVGVVGCSSDDDESVPDELTSDTGLTGGVAATVNGTEIEEDKVTRAINNMRLNYSYTEDDEWKEYLENQKETVESFRYEVIGQLVDQELVKQCAGQRGVSTDDEEIQSYVDDMASKYSSEEAWLNAVDEAGWDDGIEGYKRALNFDILEKKLQDQFDSEVEEELKDDAKLLETAQESMSSYTDAKRSSHILISEENADLANEVYEKINSGEISFEDAVAEYSVDEDTKASGGDMGWDKINTPETEYQEALTNLEVGAVSEPVSDKYGYNIIKCTDSWTAPETLTKLSEIPDEILEKIKENEISTEGTTRYNDWLEGLRAENDIQVNPIPENVPYWVDLSDGEDYSEEEAAETTEDALNALMYGQDRADEMKEEREAAKTAAEEETAASSEGDEGAGTAEEATITEEPAGEQSTSEASGE